VPEIFPTQGSDHRLNTAPRRCSFNDPQSRRIYFVPALKAASQHLLSPLGIYTPVAVFPAFPYSRKRSRPISVPSPQSLPGRQKSMAQEIRDRNWVPLHCGFEGKSQPGNGWNIRIRRGKGIESAALYDTPDLPAIVPLAGGVLMAALLVSSTSGKPSAEPPSWCAWAEGGQSPFFSPATRTIPVPCNSRNAAPRRIGYL